jgi:hypothetical protein
MQLPRTRNAWKARLLVDDAFDTHQPLPGGEVVIP